MPHGPIAHTATGMRALFAEAVQHHGCQQTPLSPPRRPGSSGAGANKANVAVVRELAGFVWVLAVCEG